MIHTRQLSIAMPTHLVHGSRVGRERSAELVVSTELLRSALGGAGERMRKRLGGVLALLLLGDGDGERRVLEVLVGERRPGSLRLVAELGDVLGNVGGIVVLVCQLTRQLR